jgi:hypothetical protein
MSKHFLAVGDYLINPELLTFAVLERGPAEPCLRLGFAMRENDPERDLRLTGDVAREVLRWLRLHSVFLTNAGGFGSAGIPAQRSHEEDSPTTHRPSGGTISERAARLDLAQTGGPERFLSPTGTHR